MLTLFVVAVTSLGVAIATAALVPMREVAQIAPTRAVRRAWWALIVTIAICVTLQCGALVSKLHAAPDVGDLLQAGVHLLGPGFVLATAWLARRTAQDILRVADLERAALVDPLTMLPNRRFFDAALADQILQCRGAGVPFHLVLLDIDHFKRVNDQFGHAIGDQVLRQVGALIEGAIRAGDRVCRIGGEEFAILCPGLPLAQVTTNIERTRRAVERGDLATVEGLSLRVTASFGAATLTPDDTAASVFSRADAALYAAKNAGRNRISVAA